MECQQNLRESAKIQLRRPTHLRLSLLLVASLALPGMSLASGGDGFSENPLAPEFHVPSVELRDYAGGKLGVVPGGYWRIYQFLAYRSLTGAPLSAAEQDSFNIAGWYIGPGSMGQIKKIVPPTGDSEERSVKAWQAARLASGAQDQIKIHQYAETDDYSNFLNCPDDAFVRAAETLQARIKTSGQQWAAIWRANQDQVFRNCNAPYNKQTRQYTLQALPALPANAPTWLKLDDAYQRAAAQFYAAQWDGARASFLAIAKDAASPWHELGNYLAARCLIRQALLRSTEEEKAKPMRVALLKQARQELLLEAKHMPAAQRLLGWLDARLQPNQRLLELAAPLHSGKLQGETLTALDDYLRISDTLSRKELLGSADSMTAWIAAMQANARQNSYDDADKNDLRKQALQLSRKNWQAKKEAHWLLAILANAKPADLSADEMQAARAVPANAPSYVNLQYQLAKLALLNRRADEADEADKLIDQVLANADLPVSGRNRFLRLKAVSSKSLDGFVQAAKRQVADYGLGMPIPKENELYPSNYKDVPRHVFQHFSLAQLKQLWQKQPKWPNLVEALWSRAVLANDFATADEITDAVMQNRPQAGATTKHLYQRFKQAQAPAAKRDAAMLIFINAPEIHPFSISPQGNEMLWGCGIPDYMTQWQEVDSMMPNFQDTASRAQIEKEQKQLMALPIRSQYLGPQLLDYAKRHPDDEEVPKALAIFVASTRMECSWHEKTGKEVHYSKLAFQLLKKQYGKTEWALRTKYFF